MKKKNLIRLQDITFGTIAVSSLFLLVGASGANAATSAVDEVTITVPASCSLTNTIGSPHTATIETGVYQDDIGETTFKVFCNDNEGFAVYAVGYTNDEFGNTTMKPSTLAVSNAIATDTATSGSTSNWAMKLTAVSGDYAPTLETGFNDYHIIPDTYTKVASYASNTDGSTGSSFKSTYGAFISQTQPADSYTGKVKYTVVHPANELPQIESISQLTYMQDYNNLSSDQKSMVLNSMAYNTTYNLIDNRDNKTYQVARLKDNKIWMAQDLDLGRTALTQDLTSTNTNLGINATNVTAETFNGWVKTSGTGSWTSAESIPLTTSNTENGLDTDTTSSTPYGTLYNYCAASAGTICTSLKSDDASSDICPAGWRLPTSGNNGEFQALYNLTDYNTNAKMRAPIVDGGAAFALTGYFYNSTPASQGSYGNYWSSTSGDGSVSLRLDLNTSSVSPTSGTYRVYGAAVRCVAKKPSRTLTVSYGMGVSNIQVDGVTIPDGGTIKLEEGFSCLIAMTPSAGYRFDSWSAQSGVIDSASSQMIVYTVGSSDTTITANTSYVATEMQNLSSSNCTTTASHVRDNRDNHVYTVQRLADGKCWMMENLDLGRTELTTDLTSSNTNLTNTVTASTFDSWKKTSGSGSWTAGEYISAEGMDATSRTPYGTLYNYCAISAGTICSTNGGNNDNVASDLCPSGWRLPTGGSSGEFKALYDQTDYNTNAKMRAPIASGGAAFTLAGYFVSTPSGQGSNGYCWSSTRYDGSGVYVLYLHNNNGGSPTYNNNRSYGLSARCVLND